MRSIPPEVLLSWPIPNYEDPITRGYALVAVNSVFITLVILVVSLRLYTRLWIKRWFGSDDAFIILALMFTVALTVIVLLANQKYGWDRHIYDIPFNTIEPTSKIAMAAKVIFTSACTFTRLSLLCFYYRLVSDTEKRWFLWAIHANVAFSVGIFISFVCLSIFQCNPVRSYWTFGAPAKDCLNEGSVTLAAGIINCIADLACTLLPIPMVMRLQMPKRQRIAVAILFSLGFIVTIAGIVRTWYIYKSLIAEYDLTWYAYPLWIAAAVEIDLGVICASAPVLRPLLSKLPLSLSKISSRISIKTPNSSGMVSKNTSNKNTSRTTLQGNSSRDSNHYKSAANSKRRSETIREETESHQVQEYEMRQWDDVERGLRTSSISVGGSQDAVFGSEDEGENDGQSQKKWKNKRVNIADRNTRGITLKSEEEDLRLERVSTKSSDAVGATQRLSVAS